jgi:hypothetical protein
MRIEQQQLDLGRASGKHERLDHHPVDEHHDLDLDQL